MTKTRPATPKSALRGAYLALLLGALAAAGFWHLSAAPDVGYRRHARRRVVEQPREDQEPVRAARVPRKLGAPSRGQIRAHARAAVRTLSELIRLGKARSPEEANVVVRILGFVQMSEAAVEVVMTRLDDPTCTSAEIAALTATLGAAGTEAGQRALLSIVRDSGRSDGRRQLAMLSYLQSNRSILPRVDIELGLIADSDGPLAQTAHLVLAALAHDMRESEPGRFAVIRQRVLLFLHAASDDPSRLATALAAVENLGPATIPARLRTALNHQSSPVRAAAAAALRRTADSDADRLLMATLRADRSADVRVRALDTLLRRFSGGMAGPDCTHESLRQLVETLATDDPCEAIRAYAAEQVGRLQPGTEPRSRKARG